MGTFDGVAGGRRALEGSRILVVDDDDDVRDAIVAILCFFGADADGVDSAAAARLWLEVEQVDVLLSDIEMPAENGYDFMRSVRRWRGVHDIAAAAVTSRASTEECRAALAAGFDLVVAKPLGAAQLVAAVCALRALTRLTARHAS